MDNPTRECLSCGEGFSNRPNAKYCSSTCRERAKSLRLGAKCSTCGKAMHRSSTMAESPTCQDCRKARIVHGTRYGYRKGCRCKECTAEVVSHNREFVDRYVLRNGVSPSARSRRAKRGAPAETPPCTVCGEPMLISRPLPGVAAAHNKCRGRFRIPEATRLSVYERDAWQCHLCGEPTDPSSDFLSDWFPSVDHVVPRSAGGDDAPENLMTAHRWCNSVRGARSIEAFELG